MQLILATLLAAAGARPACLPTVACMQQNAHMQQHITADCNPQEDEQQQLYELLLLLLLQMFYDPLAGTTQMSRYLKDKPFWILLKQT